VRVLTDLARAEHSGLVLVLHGGVFQETWSPEDEIQQSVVRKHLRHLAIQSAQRGTPIEQPFPDPALAHLEPRVHLVALEHRLTAVLCAARRRDAAWPGALIDRIASLAALRISAIQALDGARRTSEQYERWFRVSVRQMRALDRERQKFPALASLVDACVLIADRSGIVRWCSRALIERYPGPGKNGSWVGVQCSYLCAQVDGAYSAETGACIVSRLLEGKHAASDPAGCGASSRVHARPIQDAEGQTQEVIVVFDPESASRGQAA
jgi:hypothetical protein